MRRSNSYEGKALFREGEENGLEMAKSQDSQHPPAWSLEPHFSQVLTVRYKPRHRFWDPIAQAVGRLETEQLFGSTLSIFGHKEQAR